MLIAFIDETGDSNDKKYFALCCATINSNFYSQIKIDFQKILREGGWNTDIEFKGSCIFSARKGDANVPIEKRIDMASRILALNRARHNARMKFTYLSKQESSTHQKDLYLKCLSLLLEKALPRRAPSGAGKDILSLHCDYRNDIKPKDIYNSVKEVICKRSYTLLEDIVVSQSCFRTVGILYADIVGYLYARIVTISHDSDLFEFEHGGSPKQWENDGRIKKLKSSKKLLELIKNFNVYEVK